MTKVRLVLALVIFIAAGLFLFEVIFRSSFPLPLVLYAVPVLIAAYLLSPREVAGTAGFVLLFASLNVFVREMSFWLAVSHIVVMTIIGLLSIALASKRLASTRLSQERGLLVAQVQESGKWYRQIVETAQEGIWIIDADHKTTFANDAMAAMLGYTPDEMIGVPLFTFMDDEAQVSAAAYIERRLAGIKETHDFKFRRKDGEGLWAILSTNPIFDGRGQYAGALAMVTNITERRQAEEEMRQTREMVDALIGASPLPMIAADIGGHIRLWNRAAERTFGWSQQEVVGLTSPIVPADRQEEFLSIQDRLRQGETFDGLEARRQKKGGSPVDVRLWTAALRNENDEITGVMAVVADITDQ